VKHLLEGGSQEAKAVSDRLKRNGYNLLITHDLERAKKYLFDRYSLHPEARFGMVASARDTDLVNHGIPKGFRSPGEVGAGKYGRWYSEPKGTEGSCTRLETVATEFAAQGLELDACLLARGTDFIREHGRWTNRYAARYQHANRVTDPWALRMNAYRVLLTRGRDGCVVYVPPISDKMRETYSYLRENGFTALDVDWGVGK